MFEDAPKNKLETETREAVDSLHDIVEELEEANEEKRQLQEKLKDVEERIDQLISDLGEQTQTIYKSLNK